ncbi:MAG TPA: nuclear transport factor 2 family protein [Vicinamibacterales bacterium]
MPRTFMLLVALGSVFAVAACTQSAPPEEALAPAATAAAPAIPADAEDVEATISQLERDWVAAIVKKDEAALDGLLADEFAGVSPTAHYYNREAAIDDLKRGIYQVESMDLDEVSVNTYGDVAVAFASQEEKSRYAGADTSGHYHYTNVWVNKDGRWQAVASHGTRFDKGH